MGGDSLRSSQDLNTFLDIAKALNEELELSRLLTQIVDAAIDLTGAERGLPASWGTAESVHGGGRAELRAGGGPVAGIQDLAHDRPARAGESASPS